MCGGEGRCRGHPALGLRSIKREIRPSFFSLAGPSHSIVPLKERQDPSTIIKAGRGQITPKLLANKYHFPEQLNNKTHVNTLWLAGFVPVLSCTRGGSTTGAASSLKKATGLECRVCVLSGLQQNQPHGNFKSP